MPAAWIEEIQEAIDSEGLVNLGGYFDIDFTNTPNECFLCEFTINGEATDGTFTLRIPNAAQFESEEFIAAYLWNVGGNYAGDKFEVVSVESDSPDLLITIALTLEQVDAALVSDNALLLACSDVLEVSAFDVESITPSTLEINFDYPTPTPAAQPLPAPTGVSVVNNAIVATQARSTVSWNAVTNATGYKVEYKRDADTTWTSQTVSATSLQISTLTRNTLYNFRVTALGDGTTYTDSPASSVVSITTKARLAQPANFRATEITQTSITMSWDAVANSNGYRTRIKPASGSTWTNIDTKNTTASFTGLTKGTTYDVSIRTTANTSTNYDSSAFMNPIEVTTLNSTPLSTPTGLNADNITSDSARTNWQAVENASNYKVQYKAAGDTVWTETYTD